MTEYLWTTRFHTVDPMRSLPVSNMVAGETRSDSSYHLRGSLRSHEKHCLFEYTLRGEGIFLDASGEHRVPGEHGFLCEVSDPEIEYYFPPDAAVPWTFVYFCFSGGSSVEVLREMVGKYGPVFYLPREDGIVKRLLGFESMDATRIQVSAGEGAELVMSLFFALAGHKERSARANPGNAIVRNAVAHIQENLTEVMNVGTVAESLGISREHLTRLFRRHAGMSPHDYIQRQKILLACSLLKETPMTAKEVAARLSFSSAAGFTSTFKKYVRMTPSRFREFGVIPVL